jgi:hypothetical protein
MRVVRAAAVHMSPVLYSREATVENPRYDACTTQPGTRVVGAGIVQMMV